MIITIKRVFVITTILDHIRFTGVRVSVPLDTLVATIQATDVDSSAEPITYHITNLTYAYRSEAPREMKKWPFFLDQSNGQIRTTSSMASYAEGHFDIVVAAINSDVPGRHSNATTRVSAHTPTMTPGMGFIDRRGKVD